MTSGYEYKPTTKEGPAMQFEDNLEFDNIVDLQYGISDTKSFAPSQEGVLK